MIVLRLQQSSYRKTVLEEGVYRPGIREPIEDHAARMWCSGTSPTNTLIPGRSAAGVAAKADNIRGLYLAVDDLLEELASWTEWKTRTL